MEPRGTGHRDHAVLHRGGCTLGRRGGLIPRDQAVLALTEDYIRCCEICTPETGLKGNPSSHPPRRRNPGAGGPGRRPLSPIPRCQRTGGTRGVSADQSERGAQSGQCSGVRRRSRTCPSHPATLRDTNLPAPKQPMNSINSCRPYRLTPLSQKRDIALGEYVGIIGGC
ncbi:DUF6233 domain-containing protein [Streptomyces sp. NPDC090132]|uniref:DUF6233 domain-containing protein n=1 Tax=Streptomyces sp. NPDC090132 TaxID=3365955 RepID=UPI00381651E7